jgi:hypothetical protein
MELAITDSQNMLFRKNLEARDPGRKLKMWL